MHLLLYLQLPFFFGALLLKNLRSFAGLFLGVLGGQLAILFLLFLNVAAGSLLYVQLQQYNQVSSRLVEKNEQLEQHQAFWKEIAKEFPGHKTALQVEKSLNSIESN